MKMFKDRFELQNKKNYSDKITDLLFSCLVGV